MCTGRPSWKSMTIAAIIYKKSMFNININLNGIISINEKTQVSNRTYSMYTRNIKIVNSKFIKFE